MTPPRRLAISDDGLSLVEVIMAVAILGIAFVAIIGGMWTAVVTSDTHRKQALATTYLINAAEYLKSEDNLLYTECASAATFDAALDGVPVTSVPTDWVSGMAATVEYWNGTAFGADASYCLADDTDFFDLQQVTITATSPVDARATESLTFVKRPE